MKKLVMKDKKSLTLHSSSDHYLTYSSVFPKGPPHARGKKIVHKPLRETSLTGTLHCSFSYREVVPSFGLYQQLN